MSFILAEKSNNIESSKQTWHNEKLRLHKACIKLSSFRIIQIDTAMIAVFIRVTT